MFMYVTVEGPAQGGVYTEAIFGQPTYFNPLLVTSNNDAEASVIALVYAGLFRTDANGDVVKDIARDVDITDDGRTYTITLRDDVRWHDGERLNADDVMFTLGIIQNPQFEVNAVLRDAWADVMVERVDDYTVKFTLKKPYVQFLSYLRTGLLPEHIWSTVKPESFKRTTYNTEPIGAGKYIFDEMQLDSDGVAISVQLRKFADYYGQQPYINRVTFSFFDSEEATVEAYRNQAVMGTSISPQDNVPAVADKTVRHDIMIPTYFAVFFNPLKSAVLGYEEVRRALAIATDRQALVDGGLAGRGMVVNGPLFGGMLSGDTDNVTDTDEVAKPISANVDDAKALLEKNGWVAGEDGIRAKEGTVMRFSIVVPAWDNLQKTAPLLVAQWRAIGADVQIITPTAAELAAKYLRAEHDYDALLYGQSYFSFVNPAPFSFWHSSQKKRLNFAQLDNKDIDKLLERIASEMDDEKQIELYEQFSKELANIAPAVFLYSPYYTYVQDARVGGVAIARVNEPSERFVTISDWYLRTKRILK